LGYAVTYVLHDSQYLGVPQVRKRFFMVCHRVPFEPLPLVTNLSQTVREVLQKLTPCLHTHNRITGSLQRDKRLLLAALQGECLVKTFNRIIDEREWEMGRQGVKGRPPFGVRRLHAEKPSYGMTGYTMVHPTEPRCLSLRECQVLSGFPLDYVFIDTNTEAKMRQLARGVCPPVAEWLAESVVQSRSQGGRMRVLARLADLRKPAHPVHRVVDVRKKENLLCLPSPSSDRSPSQG
jgi:site-specific DNA-cytosine methylase